MPHGIFLPPPVVRNSKPMSSILQDKPSRRWLSQLNGTSFRPQRAGVNSHPIHSNGSDSGSAIHDNNSRGPLEPDKGIFVQGEVLDLAADLRTFRPGDKLDIPYELTVSESMQDFWQSVRKHSSKAVMVGWTTIKSQFIAVLTSKWGPKTTHSPNLSNTGLSCPGSHQHVDTLLSKNGTARSRAAV
jgi:hypothetical protein